MKLLVDNFNVNKVSEDVVFIECGEYCFMPLNKLMNLQTDIIEKFMCELNHKIDCLSLSTIKFDGYTDTEIGYRQALKDIEDFIVGYKNNDK